MKATPTVIVNDNIPYGEKGSFNLRFGSGFNFTYDKGKTRILYFQPQIFLRILNGGTNEVLFECRTLENFVVSKRINDEGFYEEIYKLFLSAIDDFNGYLKLKKSTFTLHKLYTPVPTIEQIKNPIRTRYLMVDFDGIHSSN